MAKHTAQNIAQIKRAVKKKQYDPEPFLAFLDLLMQKRNVSMRKASIGAGLHHQMVIRIVNGLRPTIIDCILLADYLQWIIRVGPATSPPHFMNITRQQTSQNLFENFTRFKQENRSKDFWAPGYL